MVRYGQRVRVCFKMFTQLYYKPNKTKKSTCHILKYSEIAFYLEVNPRSSTTCRGPPRGRARARCGRCALVLNRNRE